MRGRGADFIDSFLNIAEEEFVELEPNDRIDPRFLRGPMLKPRKPG